MQYCISLLAAKHSKECLSSRKNWYCV